MALTLMHLEATGLGWEIIDFCWAMDSLVTHARNACVGAFMKTDCDTMVFLDDDIGFGPGVFSRMMTHEVEFCCGIYRSKLDPVKYFVRWTEEQQRTELRTDDHHGLLEASDVPLGFSRISRAAIEKMIASVGEQWFTVPSDGMKCWELFQTEVRNHQFVGEDFYFCRKFRETGGRIWIDPELPLVHVLPAMPGHAGREEDKLFHFHLGDHLRSRMQ